MDLAFFTGIIIITAGFMGLHFFEKQARAPREPGETDMLFLLARSTETSEFAQFRDAAQSWNIPEHKADKDFNRYLLEGHLPYYVRDYLRKAKESNPDLQEEGAVFFNGLMLKKDSE